MSNTTTSPRRKRLVTQQTAADYLGVHERTIRNMISRGDITGYKVPGVRAVRIDLNELESMVQAIPAVSRKNRPMYGPNARIVRVAGAVPVANDGRPASSEG